MGLLGEVLFLIVIFLAITLLAIGTILGFFLLTLVAIFPTKYKEKLATWQAYVRRKKQSLSAMKSEYDTEENKRRIKHNFMGSAAMRTNNVPEGWQLVPTEWLEKLDIKAEAGLCQFSHAGTREFLKDIRAMLANVPVPPDGSVDEH